MNRHAIELLRRLERAEVRLLTWGCIDGAFAESEALDLARQVIEEYPEGAPALEGDLVQELEDERWLWRLPDGERYRTRMAEAVRLFARLRQLFPNSNPSAWRSAPNLVADFRLLVHPRRFPVRDQAPEQVLTSLQGDGPLAPLALDIVRTLVRASDSAPRSLAHFQVEAARRILRATEGGTSGGTIVCAGTGSGKTLAFYLPAFVAIAGRLDATAWTKCIALYPRNELLKDQLREALSNARRAAAALEHHRTRRIVLGALFDKVPRNAQDASVRWQKTALRGQAAWECPYLRCPVCAAGPLMVWSDGDRLAGRESLRCADGSCAGAVGPDELRLTREAMLARPPDILFTSTEMLNQRLSDSRYQRLLGLGVAEAQRPFLLLLDEVHTYEGAHGAHVALLLRRWRALSSARAHVVGLSATLEDAPRFFGDLVGLLAASVSEVAPAPENLEAEGAEYLLALRGDPSSGASLLSTSIQALMLLRRVLGALPDDPTAGSRVFAFTDNLDVVNRLFHNLLDAEGRSKWSGNPRPGAAPLASLRSSTLPQSSLRLEQGQSWDLVEAIGHTLGGGNRLDVRRTTSQDQGVDPRADVVVATSALEVGFDDPRVGAMLQHKAPRSAASFLQRKGRAGRLRSIRPWTVVVTSDYGRDRLAYQAYDQLFSPTLVARYLPLTNRVILRMQATYALLDWLARQGAGAGGGWPWNDLARPAAATEDWRRDRQERARAALRSLLDDAATRADFGRFLARTLGTDDDTVQAVLWEPPRALMLEAVPTLLRRLETGWRRTGAAGTEPTTQYGPPLPDFLQRTLFGDLLVPEVEIAFSPPSDDPPSMLIGQALREFAPGRVSRRFGISGSVSHWIDPGPGPALDLDTFCTPADREYLGVFTLLDGGQSRSLPVFRPVRLRVAQPPPAVLPSSNAFPEWRTQAVPTGDPHAMDIPAGSVWTQLLAPLRFHTHNLGAPLELRRFTAGARVVTRRRRTRESEWRLSYASHAEPSHGDVALGFVANVDALEVRFTYPPALVALAGSDAQHLRGLRAARLRDLLRDESRLDGVLNRFQRDWVAEAVVASVALEALARDVPLAGAIAAVLAGRSRVALATVLQRMSLWADATDDDGRDGSDEEDDDADEPDPGLTSQTGRSERHVPRRLTDLLDVLHNPIVLDVLEGASRTLWEEPDASWAGWLRDRFKATLGSAFLQAGQELCPHVDTEALLVDLDADLAPPDGDAEDRFWLTETTLGGAGALEALYREYAADPRRFFRLVEAALGPSELEHVATRLERLVALAAAGHDPVCVALRAARDATTHAESLAAVGNLRSVLADHGIVPDPSLLVSIHARLLRPNSTPATDAYLAALLRQWDDAEVRLGFDLDVRVFALATCEDPRLEAALSLDPPGTNEEERATWRYSTVRGLLWARGMQVRTEALRLSNPYLTAPDCDRLLVHAAVTGHSSSVAVGTPDWFERLGATLTTSGVAELSAGPDQTAELSDAVLRIGRDAIDTGELRVHARVVGVRRDAFGWRATFELPEAFQ